MWLPGVLLLTLLSSGGAINKPVYKIILTQKGFAQFLQYDIEIPPLREFTFCTWIRIYEFNDDQSIFTYVVNGNNRVIRLWLSKNERSHVLRVSVHEKISSIVEVDIERDTWRHLCLSYQSDHGAWALYLDSKLIGCEASQLIQGFVIPGSGSIILGYGSTTDNDGSPKGLEGEIFGANMIIASTIERNVTLKTHPQYEQKLFQRNKIKQTNNIEYIVLKDLKVDETEKDVNNYLKEQVTERLTSTRTPQYNYFENDVGVTSGPRRPKQRDVSNEREILDIKDANSYKEKNKIDFWNIVNEVDGDPKFKNGEPSGSDTQDLPMISQYEIPPTPGAPNNDYAEKNLEIQKPPDSESDYKLQDDDTTHSTFSDSKKNNEISEIETPPPQDNNNKVYGQWTSSKFAGSVLNYLKNINFQNKEIKKVPPTIPLSKYSDNFPYATEIKIKRIKPSFTMRRKNLIIAKRKYNQNSYLQNNLKRLHLSKRSITEQQKNVVILKDDYRQNILKSHAQTKPIQVEVTNRGERNHRFYRNIDNPEPISITMESNSVLTDRLFNRASNLMNHKLWENFDVHKSNSLINALPFLKSVEYFTEETESPTEKGADNIYSKSLIHGNKWHNIKSFNNDYTPRRIIMHGESDYTSSNIKYPSIKLKYKPESHSVVANNDDKDLIKGRELAMEVSNQSNHNKDNKDSVSLIKYNHGYLPGQKRPVPNSGNTNKSYSRNNFNKQIKIGNALNERYVIGTNDEQKRRSFVGGNENVPDIHKYRSDLDKNTDFNSTSGIRVCRNVQLLDQILYVQPDESIDMTHIFSPIKKKNLGIAFITENYKRCSLDDTIIEQSTLLLLNWNKTPVRLFGGAQAKKTTDLCGFF